MNCEQQNAEFQQRCRRECIRITPQRQAVFEALADSSDHPSAEMVYKKVSKRLPHISLDTVNRTLLLFAEKNIASVLPGSGTARRFDAHCEDHQHFKCIKCGRVIDFDHQGLDTLKLPTRISKNFIILRKTIYIEGICDRCRKE